MAVDRPAGAARLGGEIGEGERLEGADVGAGGLGHAVLPDHAVRIDLPDLGGAHLELADHVAHRVHHRKTGGEGDAAAAGHEVEADRGGIGDHRPHLVVVDAELLGRHQGERGAAAADVGIARDHRHRTVLADVAGGAGIGADVEPEAGGHAAGIAVLDRRAVVRRVLHGLERLDHADGVEGDTIGRLGARLGGVLQAQVDRIHVELLGQDVDRGLDGPRRDRGARRAIGRDLGPVAHDIEALDVDIVDVVAGEAAHAGRSDRRAREGARLHLDDALGGDDAAVLGGADLDLDVAARCGAGGAEHVLARHRHLHRLARLLRQPDGQGLEIDHGLAAEAAADLGRRHADLRGIDAEEPAAEAAHLEVTLGGRPDLDLAVLGGGRQRRVRLDIALVHGLRGVVLLDHHLGLGEGRLGVALLELDALGDVRRLGGRRIGALGQEVVVQDRRVGLHRLGDVDDVRQHLVVDLDQRQRLLGDRLRHRGDGGNGMALIERLLARHDVARDIAHVHLHLAGRHDEVGLVGEVLGRDHRLHAVQRQGLRRVDGLDLGMGVRASKHLADQLAGQAEVGAEAGAAGHLVGAVGTIGAAADPLVLAGGVRSVAHRADSLISAATSRTAVTILS